MIGQTLSHFRITAKLGEGGMGEVYRAEDTKLGREVAVKVLPQTVSESSEFRARFEREAQVISSLNHPNICTLFEVGEDGGRHFLVMELIEGTSLAERLESGPLPLDQVLRYGAQIAEALDQAHKQGIVHRDLKPANIMLTKAGAKLLDFGLARSGVEAAPIQGLTEMPTEAQPLTAEGTILGTFQYMAPEQLEGLEADARTDIFALGTLLYEMATGQRAFQGNSRTTLISAIVSSQPQPVSALTPMSPPALDHVIRRCLEKEPEDRWQSAHDIGSELRWIAEAGSQIGVPAALVSSRRVRRSVLTAAAIIGWVAAAAATTWILLGPRPADAPPQTFRADLVVPSGYEDQPVWRGNVMLSPLGDRMVWPSAPGGQLLVHDFASGKLTPLEGTADGTFPFWSPDGRWLAFFADQKLKKIAWNGGPVQILADAPAGRGGSWGGSGNIVFAPDINGSLVMIPEGGGTPEPVTTLPNEDVTHRNPHFLPDGNHFLFTERRQETDPVGNIAVSSIDEAAHRVIIERGSNPQWADGHVFFVRDRNLVAQPFDTGALEAGDGVVPFADSVDYYNPRDIGNFSVAANGLLVYRQSTARESQLTWLDRNGVEIEAVGQPALFTGIWSFSADGSTAAIERLDETGLTSDIWIVDLDSGKTTRATFLSATGQISAALSRSGDRLAVAADAGVVGDTSALWLQSASGGGAKEMILEGTSFLVRAWSPDGRYLLGHTQEVASGHDVAYVDLEEGNELRTLIGSPFTENAPQLSPDGKWVLYQSNESDSFEVYLTDFPAGERKWKVSQDGGFGATWGEGGRNIYFYYDGTVHEVTFDAAASPSLGAPTPVVESRDDIQGIYRVTDERMLALAYPSSPAPEPLRLIRNWQSLLVD